jgi:hypothetical protein
MLPVGILTTRCWRTTFCGVRIRVDQKRSSAKRGTGQGKRDQNDSLVKHHMTRTSRGMGTGESPPEKRQVSRSCWRLFLDNWVELPFANRWPVSRDAVDAASGATKKGRIVERLQVLPPPVNPSLTGAHGLHSLCLAWGHSLPKLMLILLHMEN